MPIIEEIDDEDIDNMEYDPADFDAHNPFDRSMPVEGVNLRPAAPQSSQKAPQQPSRAPGPQIPAGDDDDIAMQSLQAALRDGPLEGGSGSGRELPEHMKEWKVLYPLYFDRARSASEGRRVPANIAVANPLCTRIVDACQQLGLEAALELTKSHPNDWANPGRVRVNTSKPKRQLFADICAVLNRSPTSVANSSAAMYKHLVPFDSVHPLAKPRGMKINDILPGVSPALSAQKSIEESMSMENMGKMFG